MSEKRKPFWAKCPECQHCWPAAYLPMELSACAELLMKCRCPMCGCSKKIGIAKQSNEKLNEPEAA